MSVTIKEIAALANVSRGTVDKVLNNRPGVKQETRERVLRIIKEVNYRPNLLGKALVQSRTPTKIGIILTPEYNPFIQDILVGIQRAKAEFSVFGIEIILKMPISLEPAEQLVFLDELENQGVIGIAFFPIDDDGIRIKVNQLSEKGIAILTCNSKISGIHDFCFIGQNHYLGGQAAGGLMMKLCPDGGKFGIIISSRGLSCHCDRQSGFTDVLASSNLPYDIVEVQENQDRSDEAFKITIGYLQRHPDLDGIYITGGGVGGVGSALDMLAPKKNIRLICHDITPDSSELLRKNVVDFILDQSPEMQGYLIVKTLFEYLVKKQLPEDYCIQIPISITIKETL